jgi:hypothetical protein
MQPVQHPQPLRTADQVAAARDEVVACLAGIGHDHLQEVTADMAEQLTRCRTLEDVLAVLPDAENWQLALPSDAVVEKLGGCTPLLWACYGYVDPAVMAYFLLQPGMQLPWVLEAVHQRSGYVAGVPPHLHPNIGRGKTPLLKCAEASHQQGQLEKCAMLLQSGACLTARNRYGNSILHDVFDAGHVPGASWVVHHWQATFPAPDSLHTAKNARNRSALEHAQDNGLDCPELAQLFE